MFLCLLQALWLLLRSFTRAANLVVPVPIKSVAEKAELQLAELRVLICLCQVKVKEVVG